jgi:hypothetical protein
MLTRRQFGKDFFMASALGVMSMSEIGCGKSTIIGYLNAVDSAVTGILNYIGDTTLATTIQKDINAVNAAIVGWTSGTITQNVIEAIQVLQSNLDLIPLTAPITALISIALTALSAILSISGANVLRQMATQKIKSHPLSKVTLTTHHAFAREWNAGVDISGLPEECKVAVPFL